MTYSPATPSTLTPEKPTIVINHDVYDEIMYYIHRSDYEVSGMGKVVVEPGGILRVVSQIMLPQKNRSTHTQVEPEDINKLLFEMEESPRWWWHSHVNMGVFWSGEDMSTIKANAGPDGWFINTVFNKKREWKSAYFAAKGLMTPWANNPVWYDDIDTKLTARPKDVREKAWEEIYTKNVTNLEESWSRGYGSPGYKSHWEREKEEKEKTSATTKVLGLGESRLTREGRTSSTSGSTATTAAGSSGAADFDLTIEPPVKRPEKMTKRMYKMWKAGWRMKQASLDKDPKDVYGFTAEDRKALAEAGFTNKDIDELVAEDFTPNDVVEIAKSPTPLQEVAQWMGLNVTVEDIMELVRQDTKRGREDANRDARLKASGAVQASGAV